MYKRQLLAMRSSWQAGEREVAALIASGSAMLDVDRLDYLEIRDADTLAPLTSPDAQARAFVAAILGKTRLIDNLALG